MVTPSEALIEFEETLDKEAAELSAAEAEVARLKPRVEYLRMVVEGMRGLARGEKQGEPSEGREGSAAEASRGTGPAATPEDGATSGSKLTYGGHPSIPAVIFAVLDERERDLDDIYTRVCSHSTYEDRQPPSRGSVTNRLNDMATRGEIVKVGRGIFKSLPPNGGADNPDERGGPNPADHLVAEKPPGEQLIPAHQGHPYGEGSAEAASRF